MGPTGGTPCSLDWMQWWCWPLSGPHHLKDRMVPTCQQAGQGTGRACSKYTGAPTGFLHSRQTHQPPGSTRGAEVCRTPPHLSATALYSAPKAPGPLPTLGPSDSLCRFIPALVFPSVRTVLSYQVLGCAEKCEEWRVAVNYMCLIKKPKTLK